jgi:hypothetical protein
VIERSHRCDRAQACAWLGARSSSVVALTESPQKVRSIAVMSAIERKWALDCVLDRRIEHNNKEALKLYLIYIILPMLERIRPQIRLVLSMVLRMPNQLISLTLP